jgi:enhancer of polycomb-like protein
MMDSLEKATGFETIVTFEQAEALILQKLPQLYHLFPVKRPKQHQSSAQQPLPPSASAPTAVTLKQVLHDVYQYWVQKRSKLKRPLLRKFWPVTSTDDTNPHLVFRPREKEKYKLRKKRQNDLDAYLKIKQLRSDFDNLRAIMELVKRREELARVHVLCHIHVFRQRLHDLTDTSMPIRSAPRRTDARHHPANPRLLRPSMEGQAALADDVDALLSANLDVPLRFDSTGRKAKRVRRDGSDQPGAGTAGPSHARDPTVAGDVGDGATAAPAAAGGGPSLLPAPERNVAGRNHGEPAPLFLHPLSTRESFATTWEAAVPHLPSYHNAHPTLVHSFRRRPRVGRGGRICIDRLPVEPPPGGNVYYTAGPPLPMPEKARLLDLLPRPIHYSQASQRIQELVLRDEVVGDEQENDGDEVVVDLDAWLGTDDPQWGEERFAIGPI